MNNIIENNFCKKGVCPKNSQSVFSFDKSNNGYEVVCPAGIQGGCERQVSPDQLAAIDQQEGSQTPARPAPKYHDEYGRPVGRSWEPLNQSGIPVSNQGRS